ncbi:MAG: YibE/F family protein [Propionibacteriaceae bacterium]|nr:YibE/F family protein [Propionibacteriaceae bacterium]
MGILFLATVVSVLLLWPFDAQPKRPWLDESASQASGAIIRIDLSDEETPLRVRLDNTGEEVGVQGNPSVPVEEMAVGNRIQVIKLNALGGLDDETAYIFFDYERIWPLAFLAALFVVTVLAIARLKGLAAIIGLVGALAMVWFYTLPALVSGRNALLVALTTASAVMFIVVYMAHGISVKTTTALLGTFAGVSMVSTLAWLAIPASHLTPLTHEDLAELNYAAPSVDLKGVLLCGMVLAGVGVLNDVTVTQASSVWELRAALPDASRLSIFNRAMRIGRDHIASIVYTIAFAYVGTALGLLTVASTLDFPLISLLTFEDIAGEIVPTLVASIGMVLAIPITTAIGTWLSGPALSGTATEPAAA